jgi:hypothetical protein
MKTTLDDLGRIVIPKEIPDDEATPVPEEDLLVVEDGVLLFTGRLEGDPDLVLQDDREERARKVAGLD